jgi:preprotein translocase subunit YajC
MPPPAAAAVPAADPAVESANIVVGAIVEVLETFKSNSKGDKATLEPGQQGTVVKLDEDGDAFIKFDDHKDKEWVVRANFHKLRAVTDYSEEAREAPDTEKRRTRGVALQPAVAFSPRGPPQQLAPPVQASPVQKHMESRVAALQAQAVAMDMHHAMLQAEREKVASMQQQIIQSRTKVIEDIQALQGEIEKQKHGVRHYGFDTLSQTSTSAGPPSVMDEFENMKEGATVTVLEDFMSNSKADKVQLTVGQKGVVSRVDSDGDVLVKFRDHPDKEWITRNNFDKLRVSKAAKVPKADGPEVTEVDNSGSLCRC